MVSEDPVGPFTSDELLRAFRLVMSDEEAQALWQRLVATEKPSGGMQQGQTIHISSLSDDLLLLLSVESEDLRRKVEAFRRDQLGMPDPIEDENWQQRRLRLRHWLDTTDRIG